MGCTAQIRSASLSNEECRRAKHR